MVREYRTTRHTIVESTPKRPRFKPAGRFEILAADDRFALIDACVPVELANLFAQIHKVYRPR